MAEKQKNEMDPRGDLDLRIGDLDLRLTPGFGNVKDVQKAVGGNLMKWMGSLKSDPHHPVDRMAEVTFALLTEEHQKKHTVDDIGEALMQDGFEPFADVLVFLACAVSGRRKAQAMREAMKAATAGSTDEGNG